MQSYHDYDSFCPAKHDVYSVFSTEGGLNVNIGHIVYTNAVQFFQPNKIKGKVTSRLIHKLTIFYSESKRKYRASEKRKRKRKKRDSAEDNNYIFLREEFVFVCYSL